MIDKYLVRACYLSVIGMALFILYANARAAFDLSFDSCMLNGVPPGRGWVFLDVSDKHYVADLVRDGKAEWHVMTDGLVCSAIDTKVIQLSRKRDAWFWRAVRKTK